MNLIQKCYRIMPQKMKKIYLKIYLKLEGGEPQSKTFRTILKKFHGIELGIGSYGILENMFSNFTGNGSIITIGNYCSIANGVKRFNANHPYEWFTMHPLFYKSMYTSNKQSLDRNELIIGHDVWIGSGAIILPNCNNIGNGAIVGAGSIVTKNIPPYTIWAGNPAKYIKNRFDDDIQNLLEKSQWWELDIKELIKYEYTIKEPKVFAKTIIRERKKIS